MTGPIFAPNVHNVPSAFANSNMSFLLERFSTELPAPFMQHATHNLASWCAFTGEMDPIIGAPSLNSNSITQEEWVAARCQLEFIQNPVGTYQTHGGQDCLREALKPGTHPAELNSLNLGNVLEIGTAYRFPQGFEGRTDLMSANSDDSFLVVELCLDDNMLGTTFDISQTNNCEFFHGSESVHQPAGHPNFNQDIEMSYAMISVDKSTNIHLAKPPGGGYISVWKSAKHFHEQATATAPFSLCPKRRIRSCPTKYAPPPRAIGVAQYNNITAADLGLLQTRVCCGYDDNGLDKKEGCAPNPVSIFEDENITHAKFSSGEECARSAASMCVRDAILALKQNDNSYSVRDNTDENHPSSRINLAGVTDAWISPGKEVTQYKNPTKLDAGRVLWCFEDRQSVRIEFNYSGATVVPTFECGDTNRNCGNFSKVTRVNAFDQHTYEVKSFVVDGCLPVTWVPNPHNPKNPKNNTHDHVVKLPTGQNEHNPNYVSVVAASSYLADLMNQTSILAGSRLLSTGASCALLSPQAVIAKPSADTLSPTQLEELARNLVGIRKGHDLLKFCWVYEAENSNLDTHFEILPVGPQEICLPESSIERGPCDPGVFLGPCLAWAIESRRNETGDISLRDLVTETYSEGDAYRSILFNQSECLAKFVVDDHLFLRFEYDPSECGDFCKCPVVVSEFSGKVKSIISPGHTTPIEYGCTVFMESGVYNQDAENLDFQLDTRFPVRVLRLPRNAYFDNYDKGPKSCLLAADKTLLTGGNSTACGPLAGSDLWPPQPPLITLPPPPPPPIYAEVSEEAESGWTTDSTVVLLQILFVLILVAICLAAFFSKSKHGKARLFRRGRDKGKYTSMDRTQ